VKRLAALCLLVAAAAGAAASEPSARVLHFPVTVTVSGPGHVRGFGDGGSIDCPGVCSAMIREGTGIQLHAEADSGSVFTGWGGACAGTSGTACGIYVNGPTGLSAGFDVAPPPPPPPPPMSTLTVVKAGSGTGYVGAAGGIDCGPTCTTTTSQGADVTLLAIADDGSEFAGWSGGGCSGTGQCAVTLSMDTTVTATFDHVDTSPPRIVTLRATARHGAVAQLRYRVFDDSKASRVNATVLAGKGKATLARLSVPLAPVDYRRVYALRWKVPKGLQPGRRLFCVVATDAAGNTSKRSCSALVVT
jgi:Divergent InlB B-repeat domain